MDKRSKQSELVNVKDSPGKRLLEKAYKLETPDDNVSYYNKLADTYDQDFADGLGYVLPQAVARQFLSLASPDDSPIVDIGCGTGLLGQQLASTNPVIDGMDISAAMLEHSEQRNIYQKLYEVDLTDKLSMFSARYGAVLSSGTFTHGHLGPEALVNLLDIAKANALFVIAVNQAHYETMKFNSAVDKLIASDVIVEFSANPVDIYEQSGHAHSADTGLILSFRKV